MEKILIVDDEKEIRDLVEIYLKGEGYKTVKAGDGEEALYALRNKYGDRFNNFGCNDAKVKWYRGMFEDKRRKRITNNNAFC